MTLHPQSKSFIEATRVAGTPAWPDMTTQEARKTFDELPLFGDSVEVAEVEDQQVAGIRVRIYRPTSEVDGKNSPPTIVFFHGGGWVLGSVESHDKFCRRLASAAAMPVVSVEYRQPPEDPFPAAPEDCFTVCDALSVEYDQLGLSPNMILVGDSAGGNLATAVSLMARERGGPSFLGQALIYPVLDASMSTESYRQFAVDHGLTAETMAWFWQMYSGDNAASTRRNPVASPVAANDLSGLPPTYVLVAEYDVLRDEGMQFARRLSDAGVPTTLEHCDGMLHGFIHFAGVFDEAAIATKQIGKHCQKWASSI